MASRRKGKSSRPPPGRNGSLDSTEEVFVPVLDIGGDSVPKDAYIALKRAFDDVKRKLISARKESNALVKNSKHLESRLELCEGENEALKEKVQLGFQAFDQKYREHENLKKELEAVKEEGNRHDEDRGQEQQDLVVQKEETGTQTKASLDSAREENETVDNYTQTAEEKTDEAVCVPPTTPTKLLRNCGLEIVLQNGNYYLLLSDRDLLKQWLENETDGKVSVAFEKTPVFERFVQTDHINVMTEQIQCKECQENKAITIQLKNKIVDQANLIKRYREQHAIMAGSLKNSESKKILTSVEVQTEVKVYDEFFMNKQVQSVKMYKNKVSKSMHLLEQKLVQLNKELDYQNKFSNRLLLIITSSKDVPEKFVSTVTSAIQGKSGKIKKGKKPPIPRAYLEADHESLEFSKVFPPPESYVASSQPFLSLPVQETDRRLRVKISKPKDPDYDPALDEEASSAALAESRSLTSESSASIVPAEEAQHTVVVDDIITSGTREVSPTPPIQGTSNSSSTRVEQASGHDDSDEIAVIEENEGGAVGEISGAKECPICYILYTPGTSQRDYENHVMGHFQDFN